MSIGCNLREQHIQRINLIANMKDLTTMVRPGLFLKCLQLNNHNVRVCTAIPPTYSEWYIAVMHRLHLQATRLYMFP